MCAANETEVTDILLLGFNDLNQSKIPLFIFFLLLYCVILCGNILIICLVSFHEHLQMPMFFFLKHLGLADILLTSNIVPMMLHIILNEEIIITLVGCICQLYIDGLSTVQCFLLAVMSFDRYLAVCYPLHYISIMSPNVCLLIVVGCWLLVFVLITSEIILVSQLDFCDLNQIDHYFCDIGPLVALSTSDTSVLSLVDFVNSVLIISVPFIFIIGTYVCIFITILKMNSKTGRQKTFSTCSSHLTVVCTYYGTQIIVYMGPTEEYSTDMKKFLSLLYVVIAPFMNPIIYSLRSKEIRETLRKYIKMA
ncbi:hypothetical protein XENTR_v10010347 [Xenopus tropicalis]|uniref:G-protein coupled receptors family 1 profile domain-containing protein n=1 Tax=Xenopus tropicalis TaxID=8364 RepID=A0A803JQN8_XENTR|nr:hypothetical protein XENTR_v10010347 [Xenopus tropicalis]|eukprot:XP_017948244.1 PREDICTED: olfactory receptor 10A7-like [Xenopus tropicalis]